MLDEEEWRLDVLSADWLRIPCGRVASSSFKGLELTAGCTSLVV